MLPAKGSPILTKGNPGTHANVALPVDTPNTVIVYYYQIQDVSLRAQGTTLLLVITRPKNYPIKFLILKTEH